MEAASLNNDIMILIIIQDNSGFSSGMLHQAVADLHDNATGILRRTLVLLQAGMSAPYFPVLSCCIQPNHSIQDYPHKPTKHTWGSISFDTSEHTTSKGI